MRSDDNVRGHGLAACGPDDAGIAGVEAAGHVGAADGAEHGRIIAERPASKRFAYVTVQVDACHCDPHLRGVLYQECLKSSDCSTIQRNEIKEFFRQVRLEE
jgi:hypothetical protein